MSHNMSITFDANGRPLGTSVYDDETSCILPAILSDPLMRVAFDLVEDKNGNPSIAGKVEDAIPEDRAEHVSILQCMFRIQALPFSVYEHIGNYLSPRRLFTNRHRNTNGQYRQGKTHGTFGLP